MAMISSSSLCDAHTLTMHQLTVAVVRTVPVVTHVKEEREAAAHVSVKVVMVLRVSVILLSASVTRAAATSNVPSAVSE